MLLHRAGLDTAERANILAAIRGQFGTLTVAKALRKQWSDEDLARRDKAKASVAYVTEELDEANDEAFLADDLSFFDVENMEPEGQDAFVAEQTRIEDALAAIQTQKATLREARWKQKQIKLGRNFYPPRPFQRGASGSHGPGSGKGTIQCFRCGGPHRIADCLREKNEEAKNAEEEAEVAFTASSEGVMMDKITGHSLQDYDTEPDAIKDEITGHSIQDYDTEPNAIKDEISDHLAFHTYEVHHTEIRPPGQNTRNPVLDQCLGIIDCGATASLGSAEALEAIMSHNLQTLGRSNIEVDPSKRPTFKFGNGDKKTCLSTAKMGLQVGERPGNMEIHIHDTPGQPVLVSRKALRSLGAIIDFGRNEVIYERVNPKAVVPLQKGQQWASAHAAHREPHQRWPGTQDPVSRSSCRVGTTLLWDHGQKGSPGEFQSFECQAFTKWESCRGSMQLMSCAVPPVPICVSN